MMKVNSNHHPGNFTKSKRKVYFNYNIVESKKTDEHGTRTVFDYDQEEVNLDKKTIIYKKMLEKLKTDEAVATTVTAKKVEYKKLYEKPVIAEPVDVVDSKSGDITKK